jgi:hypothetical protein
MKTMLNKLKSYLETEEGKASIQKMKNHILFEKDIFMPKWIGKIKEKIDLYGENLVIETLVDKYKSDKYRDREYKCGREPQETLLYYLFYYAQEYCKESTDSSHYGMFTAEAYHIGSYIIQLNIGQGSFISLSKLKNNKKS